MTTKTDGGPAFPVPGLSADESFNGMSLRDYFAANAMNRYIGALFHSKESVAALGKCSAHSGMTASEFIAASAYQIADAMLEARQS